MSRWRPDFLRLPIWDVLNQEERAALEQLKKTADEAGHRLRHAHEELAKLRSQSRNLATRAKAQKQRAEAAEATVRQQSAQLAQLRATANRLRDQLAPPGPPPVDPGLRTVLPLPAEVQGTLDDLENAFGPTDGPAPTRVQRPVADKKEEARVDLATIAQVLFQGRRIDGVTENLSVKGAFVAGWDAPPISAALTLAIQLPGERPLLLDGVVHWHRREGGGTISGFGVAFRGLSVQASQRLEELVRDLS